MADKVKKLSDAIRIGATLNDQAIGAWKSGDKTCALQAALEAVRLLTGRELESNQIAERFPVTASLVPVAILKSVKYPARFKAVSWQSLVMWLNDYKKWSREKIADLLALTVEENTSNDSTPCI